VDWRDRLQYSAETIPAIGTLVTRMRIFNALAENATVQMQFQKTFWAAGFLLNTRGYR
jgi:hypothetical protein